LQAWPKRDVLAAMGRINLTVLWLWPLLATFVLVLMSFDNPFRLALAAAMIGAIGPVRRWILSMDTAPEPVKIAA